MAIETGQDNQAFQAMFNTYSPDIYNYIYRVMGSINIESAFDLTQDTFLRAWQVFPQTPPNLTTRVWLYGIATHECLNELKYTGVLKWSLLDRFWQKIDPTHIGRDNHFMPAYTSSEKAEAILARMRMKHRIPLILREHQDLSYDQIGQVLGLSHSQVGELLFQARRRFRQVYIQPKTQSPPIAP